MSDGLQIALFCLILLAPVMLVLGLVEFAARKSKAMRRGRGTGNVSVSVSMTDISRAID